MGGPGMPVIFRPSILLQMTWGVLFLMKYHPRHDRSGELSVDSFLNTWLPIYHITLKVKECHTIVCKFMKITKRILLLVKKYWSMVGSHCTVQQDITCVLTMQTPTIDLRIWHSMCTSPFSPWGRGFHWLASLEFSDRRSGSLFTYSAW